MLILVLPSTSAILYIPHCYCFVLGWGYVFISKNWFTERKTAAETKNFTLCLDYVIHWPIIPLLHASISWRSRRVWGIQLRDVHKAVWPLAFISEIQFCSWLWSLICKPPYRATIVLQMVWFTHGYGILQDQTSQENKNILKLLTKEGTVTKKSTFPQQFHDLTISKEGLSVSLR